MKKYTIKDVEKIAQKECGTENNGTRWQWVFIQLTNGNTASELYKCAPEENSWYEEQWTSSEFSLADFWTESACDKILEEIWETGTWEA